MGTSKLPSIWLVNWAGCWRWSGLTRTPIGDRHEVRLRIDHTNEPERIMIYAVAVAAHWLSKSYGRRRAIKGVSFGVERGQICGLLGLDRQRIAAHLMHRRRAQFLSSGLLT
jgi:hypothetical protein